MFLSLWFGALNICQSLYITGLLFWFKASASSSCFRTAINGAVETCGFGYLACLTGIGSALGPKFCFLTPKTIEGMAFGTRNLKNNFLGPDSGKRKCMA